MKSEHYGNDYYMQFLEMNKSKAYMKVGLLA